MLTTFPTLPTYVFSQTEQNWIEHNFQSKVQSKVQSNNQSNNQSTDNLIASSLSSSLELDGYTDFDAIPRKSHFEGKMEFKPKGYNTIGELQGFNINQDHSRKGYRKLMKMDSEKKAKAHFKWAVSFKHRVHNTVNDIVNEAERKMENIESAARFQDLFGIMNYKLKMSGYCLLHREDDKPLYGEMFITNSFVGFYAWNGKTSLRICIPFIEIQMVTKAAIMRNKKTKQRVIVPLAAYFMKPSVIQLWTSGKEVYQFHSFGSHFDDIYNLCLTKFKESQI